MTTSAPRELRLRVDRSRTLTESFGRGELDAALVMDPYGSPHAVALGELTLRWWTAATVDPPLTLPAQVPLVAYEPPCSFRELAIGRIRQLGADAVITAEAPHLSGRRDRGAQRPGVRVASVRRRRATRGLPRSAGRDAAGGAVAAGVTGAHRAGGADASGDPRGRRRAAPGGRRLIGAERARHRAAGRGGPPPPFAVAVARPSACV